MKKTLLFSMCLLWMLACKNDKSATASSEAKTPSIADLEQQVESSNDKAIADQLIAQYAQYIEEHPGDAESNARYLYRMASLYFRQNQYPAAADKLMELLRTYPGSKVEASAMHLLASIFKDHLGYEDLAQDLLQHIARTYPHYPEVAAVKQHLHGNAKPLKERVLEYAHAIYGKKNTLPDKAKARKYVTACEVYALTHPDDSEAAELLLKAATTARTTAGNPQRALHIYDWVYKHFPKYEKAYHALFLKAFTLDDDMKNYDEARKYYEAFLEKYPNDEFATSAKFLLKNLGKSEEEIIQQFEKKKK